MVGVDLACFGQRLRALSAVAREARFESMAVEGQRIRGWSIVG